MKNLFAIIPLLIGCCVSSAAPGQDVEFLQACHGCNDNRARVIEECAQLESRSFGQEEVIIDQRREIVEGRRVIPFREERVIEQRATEHCIPAPPVQREIIRERVIEPRSGGCFGGSGMSRFQSFDSFDGFQSRGGCFGGSGGLTQIAGLRGLHQRRQARQIERAFGMAGAGGRGVQLPEYVAPPQASALYGGGPMIINNVGRPGLLAGILGR